MESKQINTVYEKFSMYSRDLVNRAIKKLPYRAQEILLMRHGNNLDNNEMNCFYDESYEKYYYFVILPLIKENILDILESDKRFTNKGKVSKPVTKLESKREDYGKRLFRDKEIKSIYQVCGHYSREIVDKALNKLSEEDKKLFLLMNGKDFDNPVRDKNVSDEDKKRYYNSLVPKIKRRCNHLSLIDSLSKQYPNDFINETLLGLSEKDIYLYKLIIGDDINNPVNKDVGDEEITNFFRNTLPKLEKALVNKSYDKKSIKEEDSVKASEADVSEENQTKACNRKTVYNYRSIYDICNMYSRDIINFVLTTLSDKDKKLMFLMNGEDLEKPVRCKGNSRIKNGDYSNLTTRIKNRCNSIKIIMDYINKYSSEFVNEALLELSEKDINIYKLLIGEGISHGIKRSDISESDLTYFFKYTVPKLIRRLESKLDNYRINEETELENLINELPLDDEILARLSYEDIFIIRSKLTNNFDDVKVSKYLDLEVSEVKGALRNALINYKKAYQECKSGLNSEDDNFSKKLTV